MQNGLDRRLGEQRLAQLDGSAERVGEVVEHCHAIGPAARRFGVPTALLVHLCGGGIHAPCSQRRFGAIQRGQRLGQSCFGLGPVLFRQRNLGQHVPTQGQVGALP